MARWADEKERVRKLLQAPIPDDEPVAPMRFPRRDAMKRIKNPGVRRFATFPADAETKSAFYTERERIIRQLGENPILFGVFITDILRGFTDELVERWRKIHEGPEEGQDGSEI